MSDIISLQELRDAKEDARDLGDALNKKQIVVPRYGNPFNSLPLELDNLSKAIQIALAAGAGANGWTDWLIQTGLAKMDGTSSATCEFMRFFPSGQTA